MEALEARWSTLHAATLPLVRALAAPGPSSTAAALAKLPPGTLDGATLALALAREAADTASHPDELAQRLDEMEDVLDEMHSLVREARASVAAMPLDAATARGPKGMLLSPADRAMILASPLRCYETELALKRWIFERLQQRVLPPSAQVEALLVAWQCQPMLEPIEDMRAGVAEQEEIEERYRRFGEAGLEGITLRDLSVNEQAPAPTAADADAAVDSTAEQELEAKLASMTVSECESPQQVT